MIPGGNGGIGRMMNGSQGMQINRMMDALGLPDGMGDMIGAQVDAARGDWAGFARNMADLNSGMGTGQMDKLFGRGLPGPHFLPRPHSKLGHGRKLWGQTFHTPLGDQSISRERLGGRGFMGRMVGRSMERQILTNPAFKAKMERVLGGRIIPDGRADGKITVERFRPNFLGKALGGGIAANPMMSGIFGSLARMEGNVKNLAGSMTKGGVCSGGAAGAGASTGTSDAAMLKDPETKKLADGMGMSPPLSFEDMLFLMMMKYAKKKEKEIMGKMNELSKKKGAEGADGAKGGGRSRRRGYGGGIGGVLGTVGKVVGGMYGGGIGSAIGGMAGNAIGGAMGGGGAKGGGAAGGGGEAFGAQGAGGGGADGKGSDTVKQMQMQKLMEDLKKMYEMLSNVMKSMNGMQMAAVRNIPR